MPLLRDLRVGEDSAEGDTQLDQYFVRTSTFMEVLANTADVILGPKGTGKSAISRQLARSNGEYPEIADVDVVAAFNLVGTGLFQLLAQEVTEVDERYFRALWTAYIASLVGNHVAATYAADPGAKGLRKELEKAGVLDDEDRPSSIWSRVIELLKRVLPRRIAGNLTVDESGVPVLGASIDFADPRREPPPGLSLQTTDWARIHRLSTEVLNRAGRRCWVLFDRLDEAFANNRAIEGPALRALLKVHGDIGGPGQIVQTKIFLRTDLLYRITRATGFVNLTHLRRLNIRWDTASIVDLVARRIAESAVITAALGFEGKLTSPAARRSLCAALLPTLVPDAITWVIRRTSDSSGAPSPRNVITILRFARSAQLAICDRDDPDLEAQGSIISRAALERAWREVSETRLEDTIYVEFPELRATVERLRGRVNRYSGPDLAKALKLEADSDDFTNVVEDLKYAGLLREARAAGYSIPLLYRPGLKLSLKDTR